MALDQLRLAMMMMEEVQGCMYEGVGGLLPLVCTVPVFPQLSHGHTLCLCT